MYCLGVLYGPSKDILDAICVDTYKVDVRYKVGHKFLGWLWYAGNHAYRANAPVRPYQIAYVRVLLCVGVGRSTEMLGPPRAITQEHAAQFG